MIDDWLMIIRPYIITIIVHIIIIIDTNTSFMLFWK